MVIFEGANGALGWKMKKSFHFGFGKQKGQAR